MQRQSAFAYVWIHRDVTTNSLLEVRLFSFARRKHGRQAWIHTQGFGGSGDICFRENFFGRRAGRRRRVSGKKEQGGRETRIRQRPGDAGTNT
jgi:hypothetical protein